MKDMRSLVVERKPHSDSDRANGATGSTVTITATCNRFLWNMMRRIAGTLVQVGLGKITEAQNPKQQGIHDDNDR